jgi:hypothetical protein
MWVLEFYRYTIIVIVLFICSSQLIAQRQYATNSVLSKGNWYKIGVIKEGVYKIDVNFLKSIGVNVTNLNSLSIKLYGNGGGMLGESTNVYVVKESGQFSCREFRCLNVRFFLLKIVVFVFLVTVV